ncbi:MAG: beta-galactosidase [Alphaproteobacteria bacterium]
MELGVCYYPEQWPEAGWSYDARRMAAMGLARVRIGEFAWSRIEPQPSQFDWGWLDRAIAALADAGLRIVMCTPTATPPKWLIDAHPDILAVDASGSPRRFGSRRHYCFSSETYRRESARITEAVATRYGGHPAVTAWQTDNEYGCHDTVLSYSAGASVAFRRWLKDRYGSIEALNHAWGAVFWSQEYRAFDEVDLPFQQVTEGNPTHRLDFQRFASDEVAAFNKAQVGILRRHSPGRDILHNYMGASTDFDHFDVAADLDVATWDSYPLGFLEQGRWPDPIKARFMRQGHPDFTAFHHDLYRGVGRGRWWVMEQQPGPVNWAPWNPAPIPGMVRAWTWEAFAHGAELVSYFRWRQAPFAQEQMHAGLLAPDDVEAPAAAEVREIAAEISRVRTPHTLRAPVALIFDYSAKWLLDIQPQGADFDYSELVLAFYSAARRCGLDVDIVSPRDDLAGYRIVLAPSLPVIDEKLVERLAASPASIIVGPRSGSKTPDVRISDGLPPGPLRRLLPLRVARVESLRHGWIEPGDFPVSRWLEHVESELEPLARTKTGAGVWYRKERVQYLAAWPDPALLDVALRSAAQEQGLLCLNLPDALRIRARGDVIFAINYGPDALDLSDHVPSLPASGFLLGGARLPPAGVAAWRT